MEKRSVPGWIIFAFGILISFFSVLAGLPFVVIGLVLALNSNEDKIEEINYKKIKRRK